MEKNKTKIELSYFQLTLEQYLKSEGNDLIKDKEFVRNRSQRAAETFSSLIKDGMGYDEAVAQANEVLFEKIK